MKRDERTLEDLEAFAEELKGPLGNALRTTGVILERRMRERGLEWGDLNDHQVVDLFMSAFMKAAPLACTQADRAGLEETLAAMSKELAMALAANAQGSWTLNLGRGRRESESNAPYAREASPEG